MTTKQARAGARACGMLHFWRCVSVTEFGPTHGQDVLQTTYNTGMHLTDTAFAEIESRPDLLHRHLFVVIKNDDQSLVSVQPPGYKPHQISVLQP